MSLKEHLIQLKAFSLDDWSCLLWCLIYSYFIFNGLSYNLGLGEK